MWFWNDLKKKRKEKFHLMQHNTQSKVISIPFSRVKMIFVLLEKHPIWSNIQEKFYNFCKIPFVSIIGSTRVLVGTKTEIEKVKIHNHHTFCFRQVSSILVAWQKCARANSARGICIKFQQGVGLKYNEALSKADLTTFQWTGMCSGLV